MGEKYIFSSSYVINVLVDCLLLLSIHFILLQWQFSNDFQICANFIRISPNFIRSIVSLPEQCVGENVCKVIYWRTVTTGIVLLFRNQLVIICWSSCISYLSLLLREICSHQSQWTTFLFCEEKTTYTMNLQNMASKIPYIFTSKWPYPYWAFIFTLRSDDSTNRWRAKMNIQPLYLTDFCYIWSVWFKNGSTRTKYTHLLLGGIIWRWKIAWKLSDLHCIDFDKLMTIHRSDDYSA